MDSTLACNSRLQRLLWTNDYVALTEEVVLQESSFVLNKKNGTPIRMVHVGLTSTALLIAEDKLSSFSPANRLLHRQTTDCNSDLELFELIYLFPLVNIRLSVRTHSEELGLHVIRLRLCNRRVWYLELSDSGHREDKWHEWVWWIKELEQRRRKEQKMLRRHHRMLGSRNRAYVSNHTMSVAGSMNSVLKPFDHSCGGKKDDTPTASPDRGAIGESLSIKGEHPQSVVHETKGKRGAQVNRWVHHFAEHIIEHHDETLNTCNSDRHLHGAVKEKRGSKNKVNHLADNQIVNPLLEFEINSNSKLSNRSSNIWSEAHLTGSQIHNRSSHTHIRHTFRGFPGRLPSNSRARSLLRQDDVNSLSSLEDIESVASFVSSNAESWTNRHSRDTRKGLLLSVDDLFAKTNFEEHAHGHVGHLRPMASMTRLEALTDVDTDIITHNSSESYWLNAADLEAIHHCSSLPDILEGEASFLEDLPNADDVGHRISLVYLDLENDDESRTPHVINGHVMLLTKEQTDLHKRIMEVRETGTNPTVRRKLRKNKRSLHNRPYTFTDSNFQNALHQSPMSSSSHPTEDGKTEFSNEGKTKNGTKGMGLFFKSHRSHVSRKDDKKCSVRMNGVRDMSPQKLASELTSMDVALFLRIHEAEVVDCMWRKEDHHYRAKNVLAAIESFKRVAGLVADEVLRPVTCQGRVDAIIYFLEVGEELKSRQNFHSLRAVLAGLQAPAVYRLHDTWTLFEHHYEQHYSIMENFLDNVNDEGRSMQNDPELDRAMGAPPCLPFLGSILNRIIEFYSDVDINGTRAAHKMWDHRIDDSSESVDFESEIDVTQGHSLSNLDTNDHSTSENSPRSPAESGKGTLKLENFMTKLMHKVGAMRAHHTSGNTRSDKKSTRISASRKQHIKKLVIEHAKRLARENGVDYFGNDSEELNHPDTSLCMNLVEEFMRGARKSEINTQHRISHHFSDLRQMAHGHDDMPWKHAWTSEYHVHETLLAFQLAAVQYDVGNRKHWVIAGLLQDAQLQTDEKRFALSLEREPPFQLDKPIDLSQDLLPKNM
ncbi:uncharacterized protein [Diadema setosum]|uniref:uncharacterized protein n=1 Tax=Diadema setosum TaxID=31175 RepID=UPI003B39FB6F